MNTTKGSKRILTEKLLSKHFSEKFNGNVWCLWDESKRAYNIRGENLPSDLPQYANGWPLSDYITPTKAREILGQEAPVSKRILSVTVKRMFDDAGDTSWRGEYSNKATSEYSIDRAHTEDCQINSDTSESVEKLERVIEYLEGQRQDLTDVNPSYYQLAYKSDRLVEAQDIIIEAQDSLQECDCDESGDWNRGEYQFFNPSFNYVDSKGNLTDGNTPEEVRKYVRQDYERMESLNRGAWSFIGMQAVAEITLQAGVGLPSQGIPLDYGSVQTIHSGGLWGIESDSEDSYFEEIVEEQLSELKDQLHAIGFSKRAIAAAFRNVEYDDN